MLIDHQNQICPYVQVWYIWEFPPEKSGKETIEMTSTGKNYILKITTDSSRFYNIVTKLLFIFFWGRGDIW